MLLILHCAMDLAGENQSKRRKCKLEEDQPKNWIHSLPHEIAIDILSRLPVTSLIKFRFVSRASQILTNDPPLVKLHLSRTAKDNPCFIFHSDYPIRNKIYFVELSDHDDQKEIVREIQTPFSASMPESIVVGSCNGLLCLSDDLLFNGSLYVYNPFTRKHKELPKSIKFEQQEVVFGFGFHPVTKEYKVVKIIYYGTAYNADNRPWRYSRVRNRDFLNSEVQILSLSSNTWRSIGEVPFQLERRSSEALVNGRLHWLTQWGKYHGVLGRVIVSFDLADEQFREVPRAGSGFLTTCYFYLGVLGGCLSALVPLSFRRLEIWVLKEYDMKESWIKEYNFDSYMPRVVHQDLHRQHGIWKDVINRKIVRILCVMKNGKILLEYTAGNLISYDPESKTFENLTFQGMPGNFFQTVVHFGSLNWIDIPPES
ncbi:unnamed protein product [Ilex paraguariensis]|uniref:F-box domain-containing protein n=1 Tax=Ilex paraguariensis TaxID=185542 RepID=A0ABC8UH92_9AQUA